MIEAGRGGSQRAAGGAASGRKRGYHRRGNRRLIDRQARQKSGSGNSPVGNEPPQWLEFCRRSQFKTFNPNEADDLNCLKDLAQHGGMDMVFEASGSVGGARLMTLLPSVHGRILLVGIHGKETPTDLYQIFARELSVQGVRAYSSADFKEAIRLVAAGEINLAPFISQQYPLEQLQEALELAVSATPGIKILINSGA